MKRFCFSLLSLALLTAPLLAGEPGVKQTIAYLQKLQTPAGGFLAAAPQASAKPMPTLRATSAAVRALHYFGGEAPNKEACIKFVETCHDGATGGFSEAPQGKTDVFSTAVGLMAVVELKMPVEKYSAGAVKYLSDNAKSFEDIRIAVAGLESVKATTPKKDDWLYEIHQLINRDGTYGKGAGQARATGGAVVAELRLGGRIDERARILKALKAGQRQNGGYGKEEDAVASDLETTYRVMRCFVMMKALPDNVEGIRSFVAKCRNEDGGYGVAPGQPSSVGGTYYAAIITHWLKEKP